MSHETHLPPEDYLLELIREQSISTFPDPIGQQVRHEELYNADSWIIPEFSDTPLHALAQQWHEMDVLPGTMQNPSTRGVYEIAHTHLRNQLERYAFWYQMAHDENEPDLQKAVDIAQEAVLWLWTHQLSEEELRELPQDHPHTHGLLTPIALRAFEIGREQYAHKQELYAVIETSEFQVAWSALLERIEEARQQGALEDLVREFVLRLHIGYRTRAEAAAIEAGMDPRAAREHVQEIITALLGDIEIIGFANTGKDED